MTSRVGEGIPGLDNSRCLGERLERLFLALFDLAPVIERVSCAVVDPGTGLFNTFAGRTRSGAVQKGFPFRLADDAFPGGFAQSVTPRLLADMGSALVASPDHAAWLRGHGHGATLAVPMLGVDGVSGLVMCDAGGPDRFNATICRDIALYSLLIALAVRTELSVPGSAASRRGGGECAGWRDFEPGTHLDRVASYVRIIALGVADSHRLGRDFVELLTRYAPLHDIGKIGIPESILCKPGYLDRTERLRVQEHVEIGLGIVRRITADLGIGHFPDSRLISNIVGCHHEFVDGTGYPSGLSGAAVPLEARIVAVADTFDALLSTRPRKEAWTLNQAFAELGIMALSGKLDSECVAALRARPDEILEITSRYPDDDADCGGEGSRC